MLINYLLKRKIPCRREFKRHNIYTFFFQLKVNSEIRSGWINQCYGITKDTKENDYLLVFYYAENGDLHNNLSKNFKEITWENKIESLYCISDG